MKLSMAEVLRKIKQTERDAARQLSAAKDDANKIVSDARKKSTENNVFFVGFLDVRNC